VLKAADTVHKLTPGKLMHLIKFFSNNLKIKKSMYETIYCYLIIIPLLAASKEEILDYFLANGLLKNYVT
jgi:hypothetical protein